MGKDRLNQLERMSSADDILREFDFQKVIENFAKIKSKKVASI